MLIPRRDFLLSSVGVVANAALPMAGQAFTTSKQRSLPDWRTAYEQTLAASRDGELLGIPQSRLCIRQGFHPFTPDQTLILPSHVPPNDLVMKLSRQIADRWELDDDLPSKTANPSKMAILRIAQAASFLTQVYGVRKQTEDWARRLLAWLFVFYKVVAQDHHWLAPCSWQGYGERVETRNEFVDWWLILVPEGIEFPSNDGTRLHALITPILGELGKPRPPIDFWHFMAKATGLQPKAFGGPQSSDTPWLDISHMGRELACLAVNQRITQNLAKLA